MSSKGALVGATTTYALLQASSLTASDARGLTGDSPPMETCVEHQSQWRLNEAAAITRWRHLDSHFQQRAEYCGFNEAVAVTPQTGRSHASARTARVRFNEARGADAADIEEERQFECYYHISSTRPQRFRCGYSGSTLRWNWMFGSFNEAAAVSPWTDCAVNRAGARLRSASTKPRWSYRRQGYRGRPRVVRHASRFNEVTAA